MRLYYFIEIRKHLAIGIEHKISTVTIYFDERISLSRMMRSFFVVNIKIIFGGLYGYIVKTEE